MAISDETKNGQNVNYKHVYRSLKRKLKSLIHENECFKAELRRIQGEFLQVHRDNEYLLDRLMQFENFESSSSDSEATESSEDEKVSSVSETKPEPGKRKKTSESVDGTSSNITSATSAPASKKKRSLTTNTVNSGGKNNKAAKQAATLTVTPPIAPMKVSTVVTPIIKTEPSQSSCSNILSTTSSSDFFTLEDKKTSILPQQIFSNSPEHDSPFSH